MNKQQTRVVIVNDDEISVHGQRIQIQPVSFWSYYARNVGIVNKVYYRFLLFLFCMTLLLFFFRSQQTIVDNKQK